MVFEMAGADVAVWEEGIRVYVPWLWYLLEDD